MLKESRIASSEYSFQPCGISIQRGFSAYHLPKTVRMYSTRDGFTWVSPTSVANARSLGLRRADDTITVPAAPLQLPGANQRWWAAVTSACRVTSLPSGTGVKPCTQLHLPGFSDLTLPAMLHPQQPLCAVSVSTAFRRCNLASASAIFCSSVLLMM